MDNRAIRGPAAASKFRQSKHILREHKPLQKFREAPEAKPCPTSSCSSSLEGLLLLQGGAQTKQVPREAGEAQKKPANATHSQSAGKWPRSSFTSTCLGFTRLCLDALTHSTFRMTQNDKVLRTLSVLLCCTASSEHGIQKQSSLLSLYGNKVHMKVACIFDHQPWLVGARLDLDRRMPTHA